MSCLVRWRSGNAGVCKTSMRRSDSGTHLTKKRVAMTRFCFVEYGLSHPSLEEYDETYEEQDDDCNERGPSARQ